MKIEMTINGDKTTQEISLSETLLELLRRLGLKGAKKGCGEGHCGSCTVIMDDRAVKSCVVLAGQAHGRKIVTIEGLGTPDNPHPLQKHFVDKGAVQCGYCIPGMILSAKALLDENPSPIEEDVREALDGNLCRCTGYVKQIEAVLSAAKEMRG
jgi:aerobic carbon-monoxide dehydrogenase small subunit